MARGPGKGNTNNPAGKPAGTKNTKTKQWEELGAKIVGESAERFMTILAGLEDEAFTKNYLQILEYFKPKQQRSEVNSKQSIHINWEENKPVEYDSDTTDTA